VTGLHPVMSREQQRSGNGASSPASQSGTSRPSPGRINRSANLASPHAAGNDTTEGPDPTAGLMPGAGTGLPAPLQGRFEDSLGVPLDDVRVHTDGASAEAAGALGAHAFATGSDIHFGAGKYQPDDPFGQHLLAHEVAHTVQQKGGGGAGAGVQEKLEVSEPGDPLEHEADEAASRMVAGEKASVTSLGGGVARKVMRAPKEDWTAPTLKSTYKLSNEVKLGVAAGPFELSSMKLSGELNNEQGPDVGPKVGAAGETKNGKSEVGLQAEYEKKATDSISKLFVDAVKFKCKATNKGFEFALELKSDLPEWTGLTHKIGISIGKDWDKGDWKIDDLASLKWGLETKNKYKISSNPLLYFKGGVELKITPAYKTLLKSTLEGLGVGALIKLGATAAALSVPAAIMLGISTSLSQGERDKKLIGTARDSYHAAIAYAAIMSGDETTGYHGLGGGPNQLKAEGLAHADLARLVSARGEGATVQSVRNELKTDKEAFSTIWKQARETAFADLLNKTDAHIKAWRDEHYIMSAFTTEFADQAKARKLITDSFTK
jgi:hypothetical protein